MPPMRPHSPSPGRSRSGVIGLAVTLMIGLGSSAAAQESPSFEWGDDDIIPVSFASLSLLPTERKEHESTPDGLTDGWVSVGSRNEASFTDLGRRAYTFRVRGGEPERRDQWSEATLSITVAPALWQAAWFRLLVFGILALALWMVYRARSEAARARIGRLQEQIERLETAKRALQRSEDYYKALIEKSTDMLSVVTAEGRVEYVSPAVEEALGYPPADRVGADALRLAHPDDRDALLGMIQRAIAEPGQLAGFQGRLRHADGSWRIVESVASAVTLGDDQRHVMVNSRDITDRVRADRERVALEEQLRQSQKLEAVGKLTGGVAHDFNNLLTVILGNLELLQDEEPPESSAADLARQAQDAADRGARLTQRLLAFSRRQSLRPAAVDLRTLVRGMDDLLRRTLGETIEIVVRIPDDLWLLEADPTQLEQVILNLAINARDAMPDGGRLTIQVSNVQPGADALAQFSELEPGDYVALSVSDTGIGMAEEVLERAFDPFFTTKEVGEGTGLGLSMVYGFVKQSHGHVELRSRPGEGTVVQVLLPRSQEAATSKGWGTDAEEPTGRGETILVVEDDPNVRRVTVRLLARLGYTTLEAGDGPAAMELLEGDGTIDLMFTDVVLPGGMSGVDLARAARAVRPALRVLYTSGYTRDAIVHHGRSDPGVELLEKPFSRTGLAVKIAEALRD